MGKTMGFFIMKKIDKKIKIALSTLAVVLIAGRIYLPYFLKDYVNDVLNNIDGFRGHIEDVDVSLLTGSYQIQGLVLEKTHKEQSYSYITADEINLSIQWHSLFYGRIVSDITLEKFAINLDNYPVEGDAREVSTDWTVPIRALMPISINYVEAKNCEVVIVNKKDDSDIEFKVYDINGAVRNLRNVKNPDGELPSSIILSAKTLENGDLKLDGRLNILKQIPDFDLDASIERVDLVAMNPFAMKYADIDFTQGNLDLYFEFMAKNGELSGYIKPILSAVDIFEFDNNKSIGGHFWEAIVAMLNEVLENQSKNQFATKLVFNGKLNQPNVEVWTAIKNILSNGFVEAFKKQIDRTIGSSPEKN